MRIVRLRIENYKGVSAQEIEFADKGVTIVQGPNEIGKTSLAEAIGVIFDIKAGSNGAPARAIRPVHRDADPKIVLEAVSGPYHFVYEKSFRPRSGSATSLQVLEPAAERNNYTADRAHEKALQILRDTLDKDLWDALIVRQGGAILQPELKGRLALMAALDAAAGGAHMDRRAESLFELAEKKYGEYHTKDGRRNEQRGAAERRVQELDERVASLQAAIRDAEEKSRRADILQERLLANRRQYDLAVRDRDQAKARSDAVARAATALAEARTAQERAAGALDRAHREMADRARLRQEVDDALENARKERDEATCRAAEDRDDTALARAEEALRDARAADDAAEDALRQARADETYFDQCQHRDMLEKTIQSYREAEREFNAAIREIADNPVTEAVLGEILAAEKVLDAAAMRFEASAPKVTIHGITEMSFTLDGETRRIPAGEKESVTVGETLSVLIPGRMDLHVEARVAEELRARREDAEDRLRTVLSRTGIESSAAATVRAAARRQAEEARDRCRRDMLRNLGDDSMEAREQRLQELNDAIRRHEENRDASPLPPDRAAASEARRRAETARGQAAAHYAAVQSRYDAEREARNVRALAIRTAEERAAQAELASRRAAERLQEAERSVSEADLETAIDNAAARHEETAEAVRLAEAALAGLNPEQAAHQLETLTGTVDTLAGTLEADARELGHLSGELSSRRDVGIFDELQQAERDRDTAAQARDKLERAAAATRLLVETLRRHRTDARREYTEPLKKRVEELGRWIWNDSFSVDLDDESLSIRTRTLDGVTVRFDSLSGGTREQLSLIFRAACAMLVSESEGMPLILDDALGYTDQERLKVMGAILARAAKDCQVLVFTCVPERYAFVGRAMVVDLSRRE